jgi:hypothetical protein
MRGRGTTSICARSLSDLPSLAAKAFIAKVRPLISARFLLSRHFRLFQQYRPDAEVPRYPLSRRYQGSARYDDAVQTLADVPYNCWRDYDPEDTIRFYALRLREAEMLKSSSAKIIADGGDWWFLNEVRGELGG